MPPLDTAPDWTDLVDLAQERLGGRTLACSDDFFAPMENLLKAGRGVFIADKYTENGKWMDGWESRRKRGPGHDWCLVRLGAPGRIAGVDIDTNHFLGNYPEFASLEACSVEGDPSAGELEQARWTELVPVSRLEGGQRNLFAVSNSARWTHVRLRIYPDGGVARLRVHGEVQPDWGALRERGEIDLAAIENGGVAVRASDMFFSHRNNLIMPGRAADMSDGWETRRRRGPGNDWVVVRLGAAGRIRSIEVDTNHFKGNYPDRCSIDGVFLDRDVPAEFLASLTVPWIPILPPTSLRPHEQRVFEGEIVARGPFTHVRLNVLPDGGVSRLRVRGTLA